MIPRATYRLQFSPAFTFADAAALVPYLADLGVSHLYASPWLKARAGSKHGYDIIDHTAFNPELGGEVEFEQLHAALKARALGHILDFVPNHMGVAQADNAWWLDVLEWGRASPWADWFDIDWTPTNPDLHNKVLLPFLGDHYGVVLERGELQPRFDPATGTFSVWYYEHRFPLAPHTYADILRAADGDDAQTERLGTLAHAAEQLRVRAGSVAGAARGTRERATAFQALLAADTTLHPLLQRAAASIAVDPNNAKTSLPLHRLLERQAYRLACWRVAADEINYRRFFDVNGLAALRVEHLPVFTRIHALVKRLLADGKLDGLRIDHIDGLFDPAQYCRRLQRLVERPFYCVVEKILAPHEHLREDWPVHGTTGYDFLDQVNTLLVDPGGETQLTRTWCRFTGRSDDFDATVHAAKAQTVRNQLSGDLHVLARQLHRIARSHPRTRDYTLEALTRALAEVVAAFPVYRTYVDARGADADDRRDIAWGVAQARQRWDRADDDIFDFIERALTTDLLADGGYQRRRVLRFAMRFQQYTSPVMAKGYEDTALYRDWRLAGLNEVGGDPRRFGMSSAAFHHANEERAKHWPHSMLATATHDSKRGEDVRARLAALSVPDAGWARAVPQWARLNRVWKQPVHDQPAPNRNDEYLLYQTLVGAWPVELMGGDWDDAVAADFTRRVQRYMTKALREAKQHSSWTAPDSAYEDATSQFIARILDRESGRLFLEAFAPVQARVAELGVDNSLVQLVLKLTCPGVPDIYQGCELWDLNLVDPDNRRTVDFRRRSDLLAQIQAWPALAPTQRRERVAAWRHHWHNGLIKMHVMHRLLALRAAQPQLFAGGEYNSIGLSGVDTDACIAFTRIDEHQRLVVAAVLHDAARAAVAASLAKALAPAAADSFTDILCGGAWPGNESAAATRLLAHLPVVVLACKNNAP